MKKSVLFGLTLSAFISICALGCSHGSSDATENNSTENNGESIGSGNLGITFNISNAKALAASEDTNSRNARELTESSKLLKILEDGSVASAISVPSGMELSNISAVFQSPASSDIFVLFSNSSWYGYSDENGNWISSGLSQLICIHEDGSYDDVLGWDERNGGPTKNIWFSSSDYSNAIKFDANGNLYYMCYESSGNSSSSMFYMYNPKTKQNKQLTAAVSQYSYQTFAVSNDGSYIFVEGYVYGNNNSEKFLRAIPVSDPNGVRNIIYGSWNFYWVYDNYTNTLYISEDTSNADGGISKYTSTTAFASKEWVAQNKEAYYVFTMYDGTTFTMTESEIYPGDGTSNWPNSYNSADYYPATTYSFNELTAANGGIWGAKSTWNNNKEIKTIYKVLDSNREYVGEKFDLPSGYSIKGFVPASSTLYVLADILNGSAKSGYHTIFSIPATGGEYTNVFEKVPNNTTTELISWSVANDNSEIFFSGVRGLEIINGRISTSDLSYKTVSSGTRLSCITALY